MTTPPEPTKAAAALWEQLVAWQPATAAALLRELRAMPGDWPLRVFNVGRPDAALNLPSGATDNAWPDVPPEIPPYVESSWEDCPACEGRSCRYHQGYDVGYGHYLELRRTMTDAVRADKTVTVQALLEREDDADGVPG